MMSGNYHFREEDFMFIPRAQRSLKRLESFDVLESVEEFNNLCLPEESRSDGWIGVYHNSDDIMDSVFFSNQGIYVYSNDWIRTQYKDIDALVSQLDSDNVDKSSANLLVVKLQNGELVKFNVDGVQDGFRDYFTVYQFLHRLIGDLKNSAKPK
jgi:hypothetical protein